MRGENDEIQMTNDEGMTNDDTRNEIPILHRGFVIRASSLIRHLSFDIRHLA
jgi:hypothetical protein